jgi:hypothetical protein
VNLELADRDVRRIDDRVAGLVAQAAMSSCTVNSTAPGASIASLGAAGAFWLCAATRLFASGPSIGIDASATTGAEPGSSALPGVNWVSVTWPGLSGRSKPVEYPTSGWSPTMKSSTKVASVDARFRTSRSWPPDGFP